MTELYPGTLRFLRNWILAAALAFIVLFVVEYVLLWLFYFIVPAAASRIANWSGPIVLGITLGALQRRLMRTLAPVGALWTVATALGMALPIIIHVIEYLTNASIMSEAIFTALGLCIIVAVQAPLLKHHCQRGMWWIPLGGLAWLLYLVVAWSLKSMRLWSLADPAGFLIYSIISGVSLLWIIGLPPKGQRAREVSQAGPAAI